MFCCKEIGYIKNQYGQFLKRDDTNNRTIMISFGIEDYFPFGVNFFACGIGVTFHEVKNILHTVFQNHSGLNWNHDLNDNTFHKNFSDSVIGSNVLRDNVYDITVEDDFTFAQVRPYLQQMLDAALVFINTNQSLEDFHNLAEAMPISEMDFGVEGKVALAASGDFKASLGLKARFLPDSVFSSWLENDVLIYNRNIMSLDINNPDVMIIPKKLGQ